LGKKAETALRVEREQINGGEKRGDALIDYVTSTRGGKNKNGMPQSGKGGAFNVCSGLRENGGDAVGDQAKSNNLYVKRRGGLQKQVERRPKKQGTVGTR